MATTAIHTEAAIVLVPRESADSRAFLTATRMCDADDSAVRDVAAEVTRQARTPRESAAALFYWVRDEIEYTMGDWNWRASETLRLRKGTCSNKANLMVAMARSLGIPAGFHVQYVTTPSYFAGSFIPLIQRSVRDKAIHVYVTLFLDGRWVKCDPTDDKALSDAIEAIVPHARDFEFGGFVAFMRANGARYRQDSHEERGRIERDFCRFLAETEPEAYAELVGDQAA